MEEYENHHSKRLAYKETPTLKLLPCDASTAIQKPRTGDSLALMIQKGYTQVMVMEKNMTQGSTNFLELTATNPCEGCPAPCCQMQVMPWVPPKSLMSVDHIRFSLLFPNTEFIVAESGEFSLVKWRKCSLLDDTKAMCTVHSTPEQPLTCVHFNPHQCWYKRNFVDTDTPSDVYRLNMDRYKVWIKSVAFNADGEVESFPAFQEAQEMFKDIPISPTFKSSKALKKSAS